MVVCVAATGSEALHLGCEIASESLEPLPESRPEVSHYKTGYIGRLTVLVRHAVPVLKVYRPISTGQHRLLSFLDMIFASKGQCVPNPTNTPLVLFGG